MSTHLYDPPYLAQCQARTRLCDGEKLPCWYAAPTAFYQRRHPRPPGYPCRLDSLYGDPMLMVCVQNVPAFGR